MARIVAEMSALHKTLSRTQVVTISTSPIGKNPPDVQQEDWDFSRIPDSELEACYLYEYLREHPATARLHAFQSLSKKERAAEAKLFRDSSMTIYDKFRTVDLEAGPVLMTMRAAVELFIKLPNGRLGKVHEIDWDYTDVQLIEQYAEWLKERRPKGTLSHHKGIKLNSLRVHLERLGIMRLLHRHSVKEIRTTIPEASQFLSLRPDYFKDRKKALAVFNGLFPPEHNNSVKPVSWPTKSGKSK